LKPLIAISAGLAIAAMALTALLRDRPFETRLTNRPETASAREVSTESVQGVDSNRNHDGEQIDQASRNRLREILQSETGPE
jgi:hypothetical protein